MSIFTHIMSSSKYNQPPKGLFGRYCIIPYGMSKEPFIYRIVNSGVRSNTWIEPPIMHPSVKHPVQHDNMEDVIYVVCDTLINEGSKILKVALKDVELIEDRGYEYHTDHTDCIWYGNDSRCPVTCDQYRDGWNDAMEYIFKDGKGYQPFRRSM